jgi:hypothetical protein
MTTRSSSDRVTTRTITFANGLRARTFHAPADFDITTATDAELVKIGLPTRPEDPVLAEHFDRIRARLAGKFHYIPAELRLDESVKHGPRRISAATDQSDNWSGGVIFPPAGDTFKSVLGQWIVPDVDAPTENQWYYAASWVGIDGWDGRQVCQSGVECEATRTGTAITRNLYAWYEWYPAGSVIFSNFPVETGDLMYVAVCASAGDNRATVMFNNLTTGATTGANFTAPDGVTLDGACAEWIVEAPSINDTQSQLADYGQVFFADCRASLHSNNTTGVSGGDNINLVYDNGTEVSAASVVSDSVVLCEYVGTKP